MAINLCDFTELEEMLLEAEAFYTNSFTATEGGHGSKKTDAGDNFAWSVEHQGVGKYLIRQWRPV